MVQVANSRRRREGSHEIDTGAQLVHQFKIAADNFIGVRG